MIHVGENLLTSLNFFKTILMSPLTRRILSVNILALVVLASSLLYLNKYEENLIEAERLILKNQGKIFAGALAQRVVPSKNGDLNEVNRVDSSLMLRRLVSVTGARVRIYDAKGLVVTDSRTLNSLTTGMVDVSDLPPPEDNKRVSNIIDNIYEKLLWILPGRQDLIHFGESQGEGSRIYLEVKKALAGQHTDALRVDANGHLVLVAAIPVQRFKKILGVVLLSLSGQKIDQAVKELRFDIVKIFGVALAITIFLSFYLARSIVGPLGRLAMAADRLKRSPGQPSYIGGFKNRNDEIGVLASNLNTMTEALSQRIDAIETFAADVAHEIKNPLSSLRSAVETVSRVKETDQQKKLMKIIQDDVQRLDRLITDISAASRLDAELSREKRVAIDVTKMLEVLAQNYRVDNKPPKTAPVLIRPIDDLAIVNGDEGRLLRVFENLLDNSFSLALEKAKILIRVTVHEETVEVSVEDNGPGIPAGSADKIFERFYSERPDPESFGKHSGLGLSISRQIVASHGGEIKAKNLIGPTGEASGAAFIVSLPKA